MTNNPLFKNDHLFIIFLFSRNSLITSPSIIFFHSFNTNNFKVTIFFQLRVYIFNKNVQKFVCFVHYLYFHHARKVRLFYFNLFALDCMTDNTLWGMVTWDNWGMISQYDSRDLTNQIPKAGSLYQKKKFQN